MHFNLSLVESIFINFASTFKLFSGVVKLIKSLFIDLTKELYPPSIFPNILVIFQPSSEKIINSGIKVL